jgi:hypothetical protein
MAQRILATERRQLVESLRDKIMTAKANIQWKAKPLIEDAEGLAFRKLLAKEGVGVESRRAFQLQDSIDELENNLEKKKKALLDLQSSIIEAVNKNHQTDGLQVSSHCGWGGNGFHRFVFFWGKLVEMAVEDEKKKIPVLKKIIELEKMYSDMPDRILLMVINDDMKDAFGRICEEIENVAKGA